MSYHDDNFDRRAANLPPAMPPVMPGVPQGVPPSMPQPGPVYGLQYSQARPIRRRRRIPRG